MPFYDEPKGGRESKRGNEREKQENYKQLRIQEDKSGRNKEKGQRKSY